MALSAIRPSIAPQPLLAAAKPSLITTFPPFQVEDSRYHYLFEELEESGVSVTQLPLPGPTESKLPWVEYGKQVKGAAILFHLHEYFCDRQDRAARTRRDFEWRMSACDDLSTWVKERLQGGQVTDTDVFELEDDFFMESYRIMAQENIPHVPRHTLLDWHQNLYAPAVVKKNNSSGGQGIRYFTDAASAAHFLSLPHVNHHLKEFTVSPFVECRGDHYTHFRVVTLGDGQILAGVLCYAPTPKAEAENIVSNRRAGGIQIPLFPHNFASRPINTKEEEILQAHDIHRPDLPAALGQAAIKTARVFGRYGFHVQGQDWIQDQEGRYHCLEVNYMPELACFGALFGNGDADESLATRLAAREIAKATLRQLRGMR